jgi:hypothetical protein
MRECIEMARWQPPLTQPGPVCKNEHFAAGILQTRPEDKPFLQDASSETLIIAKTCIFPSPAWAGPGPEKKKKIKGFCTNVCFARGILQKWPENQPFLKDASSETHICAKTLDFFFFFSGPGPAQAGEGKMQVFAIMSVSLEASCRKGLCSGRF